MPARDHTHDVDAIEKSVIGCPVSLYVSNCVCVGSGGWVGVGMYACV